MATTSHVSRRSILTAVSASLAGTALAGASLTIAKGAAPEGDTLLLEAWAKYRAAMDHNATLNKQMEPMLKQVRELLPSSIGREEFLSLAEEAQIAYEEQRHEHYVEAWDKTGLTAACKEQQQFFDAVIDPLAETIRNTAPTTLKGVAIKAIYMLDYARPDVLCKEPGSVGDEALCQFIEQLADLAAGEA